MRHVLAVILLLVGGRAVVTTTFGVSFLFLILGFSQPAAGTETLADGAIHIIATDWADDVIVNDSGGGMFTTVNYVSGGASHGLSVNQNSIANLGTGSTITTGGFNTSGNASLNVSEGAAINGASNAYGNSTVNFSGGSFSSATGFGTTDTATTIIDGGTFDCSAQQCLTVSKGGWLTIFDAIVTGGTTASVFGQGVLPATDPMPQINIFGGTYSGALLATSGTTMNIYGGEFSEVVSTGSGAFSSTVTIFGSDFLAVCDPALGPATCSEGEVVVNGFGVIDINFSGTITGTLSDGTPLDIVDALNSGFTGSRIFLSPIPTAVTIDVDGWVNHANTYHPHHNRQLHPSHTGAGASQNDPVAVTIYGAADFDANQVDGTTLRFGPGNASKTAKALSIQEETGDSYVDATAEFLMSDIGLDPACTDTELTLIGENLSGDPFTGTDTDFDCVVSTTCH